MFLSAARNILPVLVMVCLISFIVRGLEVWSGMKSFTGAALAVEQSHEEPPPVKEEVAHGAEMLPHEEMMAEPPSAEGDGHAMAEEGVPEHKAAAVVLPPEFDSFEMSEVQAELVADLVKQRQRLDEREAKLVQQEALLSAAEKELNQKYQELVALRKDIEDLLGTQEKEEDSRINSLVKIYENMKAKEAADIFNTLDLDILVDVISRMSERKVSPILAAMNPERARTVTIMLAEQKKLPQLPTE